jgi:Protein of unknown function (DUF3105)
VSKKLQEKQQRRLAEQARKARQRKVQRRANLITIAIAVVVLTGVAAFVYLQRDNDAGAVASVGGSAADANCTDIESHPSEGNKHVDTGTTVNYGTNPPTTGNHWPTDQIAAPGFYAEPVESERLVHNMEHGGIIIWYRPEAPQEVEDKLQQVVEQQPEATIAVPWGELESPYNFALTAWFGGDNSGKIQSCEQVSQEVIDDFRARFQGRGPEQAGIPPFEPGG